jgi:hypothetical protein
MVQTDRIILINTLEGQCFLYCLHKINIKAQFYIIQLIVKDNKENHLYL